MLWVQIDYDTRQVQRIVQLHLAPLNALAVYAGRCYSGADDRQLRAWPLDFSHIALEACHDAAVTAVNVHSFIRPCLGGLQHSTVGYCCQLWDQCMSEM